MILFVEEKSSKDKYFSRVSGGDPGLQKGLGGNMKENKERTNIPDEWAVDYTKSEEENEKSFGKYTQSFDENFEELKKG